jgi:hypothetical protein
MSQITGRENELKSQGAAEAARSPDSNVSARDAEQAMVEESIKAGAVGYQFDPNASPEEKAAQAISVSGFNLGGGRNETTVLKIVRLSDYLQVFIGTSNRRG